MTADAVFPPRCSHVPVKASEFSYEDASSALPPAVSPSSHPSPQVSAGPGHGGHFPEVTTSRPKPQGRHAYVTQCPLEGRGTARLHTLHGGSSFQKLPSCGSLLPCPAAALLLSAWLLHMATSVQTSLCILYLSLPSKFKLPPTPSQRGGVRTTHG